MSVCVKLGCDMGSSLPANENLTFHVLKRLTGHGSNETGALPERRNCFDFRFLAEFAFEGSTDGALNRGRRLRSIVDQHPHGWLVGPWAVRGCPKEAWSSPKHFSP